MTAAKPEIMTIVAIVNLTRISALLIKGQIPARKGSRCDWHPWTRTAYGQPRHLERPLIRGTRPEKAAHRNSNPRSRMRDASHPVHGRRLVHVVPRIPWRIHCRSLFVWTLQIDQKDQVVRMPNAP